MLAVSRRSGFSLEDKDTKYQKWRGQSCSIRGENMSVYLCTRLHAVWRIGALLPLLVRAACDQGAATSTTPPAATGGSLRVVVTTTQIRSMAEAVTGDLATVTSIIPPGA